MECKYYRHTLLLTGSCIPFSFMFVNEQHSPQILILSPIPAFTSILAGFISKELCILGPCIKRHYLFMPLHLLILLYPWTLHTLSNYVLKAQWTFKPCHETHRLVSVLAEWRKPFSPPSLFRLLSLELWKILGIQDLFSLWGLRNLLLKFSLMATNRQPHWTRISSPKPQTSC